MPQEKFIGTSRWDMFNAWAASQKVQHPDFNIKGYTTVPAQEDEERQILIDYET